MKLAFLGAGKMASALAAGLARRRPDCEAIAFDISQDAARRFRDATGFGTAENPIQAVEFADTVMIAVKPQNFSSLFDSLPPGLLSKKLIISIMAGIRISAIEKRSSSNRVIRVMPNTPALAGKGISAFAISKSATPEDISLAEKILSCVGEIVRVDEDMMDAVTALSGSGPAYVFEFIEALARAGEKAGIPYRMALKLAASTAEGSIYLLRQSDLPPDELKANVTSPGGSTAAALEVLSKAQFRRIISDALIAAKDRSIELGKSAES